MEEHLLKVQSQVCGENSLFQELHHVAVLLRAEVRKDVVALRRTNTEQIVVSTDTEKRKESMREKSHCWLSSEAPVFTVNCVCV